MPEYDNTNRGVLFKNDKKEKDIQPDLKGSINVNGVDYWLSGWTRRNEDGSFKLTSLSVQEKNDVSRDIVAEVSDEPINLNDIPF